MLANNWTQLKDLILFSLKRTFNTSNKQGRLSIGALGKKHPLSSQTGSTSKNPKKRKATNLLNKAIQQESLKLIMNKQKDFKDIGRVMLRDKFFEMTFNKRQKMGQRTAQLFIQAKFEKQDFYDETNVPQIISQNSSEQEQRIFTLPVGIIRIRKFRGGKNGESAPSANAQLFLEYIDTWLEDFQAEALVRKIQDYATEQRRSKYLFNEIKTSARTQSLFAGLAEKILNSSASISIEYTNSLLVLLSLSPIEEVTVENMRRCNIRQSAMFLAERLDKGQFERNIFQELICTKKEHYNQFVKQDHPNTKLSVHNLNAASRPKSNYTLQLKQSKPAESAHFIPKIQFAADQIVIDAQSTFDEATLAEHQEESKKWLYLYDLPFELSPFESEQMIVFFNDVYSPVTEYILYSHQQLLPQKAKISYSNVITKYENSYVGVLTGKDKKKAKEAEGQMNKSVSVYEKVKGSLRIPKSTLKIAKKICDQAMSKLNKTVLLIRFNDEEGKKKMIQNGVRNFGLNYKNIKNIRVEEGFCKNSVVVKRVPWGCQSKDLLAVINQRLQSLGIKISLEPCIIVKGFFIIRFKSLIQAIQAMKLINLIVFQQHHLKALLCYGACKIHKNIFVNQLTNYKDGQLRKRIGEITISYLQNLKENNTYSSPSLNE